MSHAIKKAKSLIVHNESVRKAKHLITRKENVENQYKSKLTICIEILCAIVSNGTMNLTQLTHNLEMTRERLIPHLRLLKNRGLIEKQILGENKIVYTVTERGIKVLKVVNPIIKQAHKIQMRDFETISNTLSGAGY
jgi:predicted transcriptional regulator